MDAKNGGAAESNAAGDALISSSGARRASASWCSSERPRRRVRHVAGASDESAATRDVRAERLDAPAKPRPADWRRALRTSVRSGARRPRQTNSTSTRTRLPEATATSSGAPPAPKPRVACRARAGADHRGHPVGYAVARACSAGARRRLLRALERVANAPWRRARGVRSTRRREESGARRGKSERGPDVRRRSARRDRGRAGRPFVGQAGQLLTKILAAIDLPREAGLHLQRAQASSAGKPQSAA